MPYQIVLNTDDPSHADIEAELREQLSALETVQFDVRSTPAPAGTLGLPGLEQVTAFIIQHPEKAVSLAIALVNLINTVLSRFPRREATEKKRQPPRIVLIIDQRQLTFPSSENQQDKFLKGIESEVQSDKAR
jgi:hypothetical protein